LPHEDDHLKRPSLTRRQGFPIVGEEPEDVMKKDSKSPRERLAGARLIGFKTEAGAVRKPAIKALQAEIKRPG